jgi:hypothetical protein
MDCKGDYETHIVKKHESLQDAMGEGPSSSVPVPWQAALYPTPDWDIAQDINPDTILNKVIQAWEGHDETT